MKVLQVASALHDWGGIERYVQYLTDGLRWQGHEVTVACPPNSPLHRRILDGVVPISVRQKHDPRVLAAYLRHFRAHRYDVVHGHFSPDFLLPALAAKLTRQPRTIMTRHVAAPWSRPKARHYLRLWDHIIPVSDAVRVRLAASGVPEDRMTVAKAGTPVPRPQRARDDVRAEWGSGFHLGYFGRLVPDKGIETLLRAATELPAGVQMHIFGDGPLRTQVDRAKGVRSHGFVENVTDAMNAMDATVIPSEWEEAFPYAALESMALGVSIVASNVGGLPEVVQPEVTGLLFPKGDASAIARAVRRLQESPDLRAEMAAHAQRIHRETYTVEQMAARIAAIYETV